MYQMVETYSVVVMTTIFDTNFLVFLKILVCHFVYLLKVCLTWLFIDLTLAS